MLRPSIFPFWVILTYLYAIPVIKIVMTICKIPKHSYWFFELTPCVALISFCVFVLACTLIHIFVTLMHLNDPRYGFVSIRDFFGLSIYNNSSYFIYTLVIICICVFLCYKLNMYFTMTHLAEVIENKKLAVMLISVFTSPLIFFIPLEKIINTIPIKLF